jgi:hypothetical protein
LGPFLNSTQVKIILKNPYLRNVVGIGEGEHKLDVKELNTKGK